MQIAGKLLPFMKGFPAMDGNLLKKWFTEVALPDPGAPIGYMVIIAEVVWTSRHDEPQNTADVLVKYHFSQVTSVIVHHDGLELVVAIHGQPAIVYADNTHKELLELLKMVEEDPVGTVPSAKSDRLFIYSFPALLVAHLEEEADRKNAGSPTSDQSDR
ncbi:hypothetical protein IT412_01190 [Candidatus Peregrinibacteria bacterium]|nr:hypothetical protein [Candidatus Peregrinibacteria bacterium]